jgi:hypothetical protein
MPFPSPSIFTLGQLARKYLASAHDCICEQYFRVSQLKAPATPGVEGATLAGAGANAGAAAAAEAGADSRRFLVSAFNS